MRRFIFFTVLVVYAIIGSTSVFAQRPRLPGQRGPQATVTPTPQAREKPTQAAPVRTGNCDVCGYCAGSQPPSDWESCRRCLYPTQAKEGGPASNNKTLIGIPEPDSSHFYTDFGCISTSPGEFTAQITSFFFSIIGGIAFLYFLYGSGVIATSRADPERLNYGKRIVYGSIIGLLFAIFSVFIIRFLSTSLGLPGIGG
ncbi:MAG: pilin [Candidatus Paceibacterota bacterium]